jgi:maltose alpha-D-glucosyltransferase/alpha-amylase
MALAVRSNEDLLTQAGGELAQSAFSPFLQRQRWFGGKARSVQSVAIRDWQRLSKNDDQPGSPLPCSVYFAILDVRYTDSGTEQYFVPLSLRLKPSTRPMDANRVVAELETPQGACLLIDALADDEAAALFLTALERKSSWKTQAGQVSAQPTSEFVTLRGRVDESLPIRRGSSEQSNTNIHFGERLILKVFRRCENGPNPDFEITQFLTERTSFRRVPRLGGGWLYEPAAQEPLTLAMMQGWVANEGNAWEQALEQLSSHLNRITPDADEPIPIAASFPVDYSHTAALLGRRTAELHRALASDDDDPHFRPEPLSADDLQGASTRMRGHLEMVLALLKTRLPDFSAGLRQQAKQLLDADLRLFARLTPPPLDEPLVKIRCHGDYHLGQVLVVREEGRSPAGAPSSQMAPSNSGIDFVILDFEGEPARPLAERRAKYSPLKDVAGMVRSFHYAAHSALLRQPAERRLRLESWAGAWQHQATAAFLMAYCDTAAGSGLVPQSLEQLRSLLDIFLLEKALYELHYELNNRPDWVAIPVQGLLGILGAT